MRPLVLLALGRWRLQAWRPGLELARSIFPFCWKEPVACPSPWEAAGAREKPRAAPGGSYDLARTQGAWSFSMFWAQEPALASLMETSSPGSVPCSRPPAEPAEPAHLAGEQTEALRGRKASRLCSNSPKEPRNFPSGLTPGFPPDTWKESWCV